jgi:hypothetical protein
MNKSIQLLHSFRGDKSKMLNRLSLLSFLDSLSTFAMHSVVIPAIGEAKWENARNIDELFDMQLKLLNEIETKLFLNVYLIHIASCPFTIHLGYF